VKELLLGLADKVQRAVMAYRGDFGKRVGTGAYGFKTSAIDKIAEETVLAELEGSNESLNVLSEEAGFVDRGGELTLVLDPVDGTHNAERGLPIFSTSMAIGKSSMKGATHALVRELVSGRTYYAARGKGAYLDGRRIHVRRYDLKDSMFMVYLGKNAHDLSYGVAKMSRRVRSLGAASLDMCMVATGASDLYYMNSAAKRAELRVVDIAASALILREAGGEVLDLDRRSLDMPYDAKQT